MPYFTDLHTYLHQSSLLTQAYPSARITTKYSLPRKANTKARRSATTTTTTTLPQPTPKREPSAVLTLKTYHPESGICLKYRTDKAAEVGRLLTGLGRLAKGEVIEMPSAAVPGAAAADADKMDIDAGVTTINVENKVVTAPPAVTQTVGGGGGAKGKKKKGKK
jgi:hypothetical protein